MIFSGAGGGSPLNFKVVGGTTAPANPKENTIWVNTEREITYTLFMPFDPEHVMNGLVWIRTGTTGAVSFNALKKNGIVIFPISVKQRINSKWVDKTAKIYLGGVWKDFITHFFVNGDECTDLTGGWVTAIYDNDASRISATKTISGSEMQFRTYGDAWREATLKTTNAIDLTPYKTLYFKVTYDVYGNGEAVHEVGVFSSGKNRLASTKVTKDTPGIYSVNVEGIYGSYCIGIFMMTRTNGEENKIYVTDIWAE